MHYSNYKNNIFFLLIFSLSFWFNFKVNANIYTVDNFKYSEKISNIKKNRSSIIDKIKIQAFDQLKKRLLVEDDLNLIKSNNQALNLIDDFIIKDEIQINKNYQFVVSIKFNADKVKSYFKSKKIRYVDFKGKPILVIYLEKNEKNQLNIWNNKNFYNVFFSFEDYLIEYISPGGDLLDQKSITLDQNLNLKDININKLLNNYGLKNFLIIYLDKNYKNNIRTKLSINNSVYYKSFLYSGNYDLIIPKLKFFVENIWKEQNIFNTENTKKIVYNFYPKNADNLNLFIKTIFENKNISEKKIELVSKKKVVGSFIFSGSEDELIENLENKNIKIRKQNNNWDIYYNE
ncbi:MAG: hypothetical protein CMI81_01110 [Candidatus Pelagibacter sp.]|nr:hypothetical protein [Candidatus Pelagibacter sp.]OUV98255.1 MAG: hypothetical protein CBD02_01640 [Candidatus Pelagibacter sp. TMED142]|tara:strand:- start:764 stop:1801 length:1038 start_codon:yes stop_codon:yes gene_type:complete